MRRSRILSEHLTKTLAVVTVRTRTTTPKTWRKERKMGKRCRKEKQERDTDNDNDKEEPSKQEPNNDIGDEPMEVDTLKEPEKLKEDMNETDEIDVLEVTDTNQRGLKMT